jgi:hypothetical protein
VWRRKGKEEGDEPNQLEEEHDGDEDGEVLSTEPESTGRDLRGQNMNLVRKEGKGQKEGKQRTFVTTNVPNT